PIRGVGAGAFQIPPGAAGGEYTLTVSEDKNRFPPEKRKFIVNQYKLDQLHKKLEFTRKSFGPGEEVTANGKVSPAEGGQAVATQPVVATAQVDGSPVEVLNKGKLRTAADGTVEVRLKLPAKIERGEASLSVQFTDGANLETIVRPIPIVLKKL